MDKRPKFIDQLYAFGVGHYLCPLLGCGLGICLTMLWEDPKHGRLIPSWVAFFIPLAGAAFGLVVGEIAAAKIEGRQPFKEAQGSSKIFPEIRKADAFFGEITADGYGFWCADRDFVPTGTQIVVLLEAGAEGPSAVQQEFFRRIETRYDLFLNTARVGFLESDHPFPTSTEAQDLFDSLCLEAIQIGHISDSQTCWEMSFTTDLDDHIISFCFEDWTYRSDRWDG
jgi:hypothetical protein